MGIVFYEVYMEILLFPNEYELFLYILKQVP